MYVYDWVVFYKSTSHLYCKHKYTRSYAVVSQSNCLLVKLLTMVNRGCVGFILLWLIAHCMISGVTSSHFRGGIFMVRPKLGGSQGEVSLTTKWF